MTAPYVDPFAPPAPAPAPVADEAQAAPANVTTGPWTPPADVTAPKFGSPVSFTEGKVTVTFKGGTNFDSPWIVIYGESVQEALDQITGQNATVLGELMTQAQRAGQHFSSLAPAPVAGAAPATSRSNTPPAAQQPPPGSPAAPGHDWVFKSGVTKSGPKAGSVWKGWMPPDHAKAAGKKPLFFD